MAYIEKKCEKLSLFKLVNAHKLFYPEFVRNYIIMQLL